MSYILDALKKAEAERERGQVPGLHAATASHRHDEAGEGQRLPSWVWAVLGALMMLIAALVWSLTGHEDAPMASQPTQALGEPPAHQALPPTPSVTPSPTAQATAHEPTPAFEPTPNLSAAPPPAPARRARQTVSPAPDLAATDDPQPAFQSSVKASPKSGTVRRAPAVNELPEDIRQALPTLQFGGAMYSDQPSNRMLIINSKAFHEGDHVMNDLVLREIQLRSAVLVFRGYAYSVNY